MFVQLNYKSTGIICICEGTSISSWTVSRSNSLILLRYSLFFILLEINVTFEGGTVVQCALQCAFQLVEDETAWWLGAEFRLDSARGGGARKSSHWFFRQTDYINKLSHQRERDGVNIQITGQWQEQKEPFHKAVLLETSKNERRRNRERIRKIADMVLYFSSRPVWLFQPLCSKSVVLIAFHMLGLV